MKASVCIRRTRLGVILLAAVILLVSTTVGVSAYSGPVESANARYVVASYQQFLQRDPADSGLDFHLDRLVSGGDLSREQMARSLLFGPEGSTIDVERAYQSILGRGADARGSAYWAGHLQRNDVLDLRVLLLSSDEYRRRNGGTDAGWIAALYRDILGRSPEAAGLNYWSRQAARGVPRPLIVAGFYLGRESLGRRTTAYYQLALQRNPTAAERSAGASLIAREGERALYARLWASDEAFETYFDERWES
ncbi:MAG: DUF4214 domain-containing protein [Acidimicrobiia bacterium]|nr:DUF4214 domain-containing protein [Acidimicrobiia bacterium]